MVPCLFHSKIIRRQSRKVIQLGSLLLIFGMFCRRCLEEFIIRDRGLNVFFRLSKSDGEITCIRKKLSFVVEKWH